ncbi:hypothetical protein [Streptomyces sp. BA2]|uniref:hypothetical protein n=1 Tax=Streptomyces sp. BA2 TaxID=436595 RepID=UPI003014C844
MSLSNSKSRRAKLTVDKLAALAGQPSTPTRCGHLRTDGETVTAAKRSSAHPAVLTS